MFSIRKVDVALRIVVVMVTGIALNQPALAQQNTAEAKAIVERILGGDRSTGQNAAKLSFLMLNKDGSPQFERAAHLPFYTGEIFILKIRSSTPGTLRLTNISPSNKVTSFTPMPIRANVDTYYPDNPNNVLEFSVDSGEETLLVEIIPDAASSTETTAAISATPARDAPAQLFSRQQTTVVASASAAPEGSAPAQASAYFSDVQGKAYPYAKDVRETVLETQDATYLTRPAGSGNLVFEVKIQHY